MPSSNQGDAVKKLAVTLALLFAALLVMPSTADASQRHRHSWVHGRYHHHPYKHHAYVHRRVRHRPYTHHHRTYHNGRKRPSMW